MTAPDREPGAPVETLAETIAAAGREAAAAIREPLPEGLRRLTEAAAESIRDISAIQLEGR